MKRVRVTMPKWPAYVMGAFALACAYPAITASAPAPASYGPAKAVPAVAKAPVSLVERAAAATAKR